MTIESMHITIKMSGIEGGVTGIDGDRWGLIGIDVD
jgi:hypothetical protein